MRQNLLIDADDTLWENNIYFERAFDEFVSFLDHSSLTRWNKSAPSWMKSNSSILKFMAMALGISRVICAIATSGWWSAMSQAGGRGSDHGTRERTSWPSRLK